MSRRLAAIVLLALAPLTLAAADPRGDATACLLTHGGGDPPDLVRAVGWLGEEGSTAVWRLTFARPLEVPDPVDPPFRVDVLVRDPRVPTISFGNYRRWNRIVRFDASSLDAPLDLVFGPEGGHTPFNPPTVDGNTLTLQIPGRLLLGTDLFGRVDLERLRWSVVVRDGGRCDLLGSGVPTLRLASTPPASASVTPTIAPPSAASPAVVTLEPGDGSGFRAVAIGLAAVILAAVAAVVFRRRR